MALALGTDSSRETREDVDDRDDDLDEELYDPGEEVADLDDEVGDLDEEVYDPREALDDLDDEVCDDPGEEVGDLDEVGVILSTLLSVFLFFLGITKFPDEMEGLPLGRSLSLLSFAVFFGITNELVFFGITNALVFTTFVLLFPLSPLTIPIMNVDLFCDVGEDVGSERTGSGRWRRNGTT